MRIKDAIATAETLMDIDVPVMFWGPPGIGKSDIVRQIAASQKRPLIDIRLSQKDPVDLSGLPYVVEIDGKKVTNWAIAEFFTRLEKEPTTLFFDEINSAQQSSQAAAYQIILDRAIGEHKLPAHTRIFAAGNNITDGAIVNQMSSALRNRFGHIDVEEHLDDFCNWAVRNGINTEILGFLRFKSIMLNEFNQKSARANKAFATPRGWARVSRLMDKNIPEATEFYAYSAIVGEGPAVEFRGYLKHHRNIPTVAEILANPDKVKIPEEPAVLYALGTTLGAGATEKNFAKILDFGYRLPAEYQIIMCTDAVRRNQKLAVTAEFRKWTVKNSSVVF